MIPRRRPSALLAVLFVALVALAPFFGPPSPARSLQATSPSPAGRYIVTLRDDAGEPRGVARALERRFGARIELTHAYTHALNGFAAALPRGLASRLTTAPEVVLVEPDQVLYAAEQLLPTGVDRIDGDSNTISRIDGVDERVDVGIAILDTGSGPHADLNVVGGYDCTATGSYNDNNGHGSHVAGVAAAIDNNIGVVGVAPGARIFSVKVLGSGATGSWSWVICGIDWLTANASANGISIANLSLTGFGSAGAACSSSSLRQAICNLVNGAGVTVVAAAGNSGASANSYIPAAYPEVIAVGALADSDGRPGGLGPATSRGCDDCWYTFSNYGGNISFVGPGVDIYSTVLGGAYGTKTGTSQASPTVSGAAALFIAINGPSSPSVVRSGLQGMSSATTIPGNPAGRTEYVLNLGNGFAGPPTPTPSPSATATATSTPTATATATPEPTSTNTPVPTATSTPTAVPTSTPLPTATSTATPTNTPLPTPTSTATSAPTSTATATATNTPLPTNTAAPTATSSPTPIPTSTNTPQPTATATSTPVPTATVTTIPSATVAPSATPTSAPSATATATATSANTPTATPVQTGTPLTIVASGRTSNSSSGLLAYDNDLNTYWYVGSGARPKSGYVWFDLGSPQQVGAIRWIFAANSYPGFADGFTIEISNDRATWTQIAAPGGAPVETWQSLTANVTARYIRFSFDNPSNLKRLGFVAEVQFLP